MFDDDGLMIVVDCVDFIVDNYMNCVVVTFVCCFVFLDVLLLCLGLICWCVCMMCCVACVLFDILCWDVICYVDGCVGCVDVRALI